MEPESSSPYPQVPAICPYPEPTPSSPHDTLQLSEDPSWYYPPIYVKELCYLKTRLMKTVKEIAMQIGETEKGDMKVR
jgi:hypothetical protein